MMKNYLYIFMMFFTFLASDFAYGQSLRSDENTHESVSIYPNPATGGKVHISSKSMEPKEIEIFDILGKRVMQVTVSPSREINISTLTPGVYIVTIKEADHVSTRKLIVK